MALMDGVFWDFEMVKVKCIHDWSDITQNVRLYEIHMHAKYGSNSLKGKEILPALPKGESLQTPDYFNSNL